MPSKQDQKLPMSVVKKLPYKSLNRMIKKMRDYLKKNETVRKMFKEYDVDIQEIDYIPMMFGNLDVSAKTDHGVIIYNYKLLTDGDFFKDFSYGVHEMTHWLQQTTGDKATRSSDDGSYLDNPYEQEGFQNQVEYIADQFGDGEAEKYVDDLLEHHEIDDKKEVEEKKEILMAKATPEEAEKYHSFLGGNIKDVRDRIKLLKKLVAKYHPDSPERDVDKFKMLMSELSKLQTSLSQPETEMPFISPEDKTRLSQSIPPAPTSISPPPAVPPPWGNWFDKYIRHQ